MQIIHFFLPLGSSILLSVPVCSREDVSGVEEDQGRSSTGSPASDVGSGHPLADKNEPSSPQNVDCHRNVGLVQSHSSSFTPEERLQQQDPPSSLSTIPVSSYHALQVMFSIVLLGEFYCQQG